ncbi:hypothetical protein BGZ76_003310 [Entomortierella beljakovae]|nr:hypothetical protein BGZ76_003310 [Entomortierella beljakovae]
MTSGDMNESAEAITSTSINTIPKNLHKKRPSSTMSPPHSFNWGDSYSSHTHSYERPLKTIRQSSPTESFAATNQPWTNDEQEALYIAVVRYKLCGRWAEVKDRMELRRSSLEIEQEYMRLYGEVPDSEDDSWEESEMDSEAVPTYHNNNSNNNNNMPGHITPALTSTSSTLSAKSSRETFNLLPPRLSQSTMVEQPRRNSAAKHSTNFHEDENDDSRMDIRPSYPASRLPSGKNNSGASSSRNRSDATAIAATTTDSKPTRTVRVWTVEQSEQLKGLIEDCFPGGYRINWVWVASQMGNTFTRKQCKNKWEIMRRRAGTEEEIALLKKGYDEFGPHWSKIQEKYLPERSQGGISIMWNLLQTREAEQLEKSQAPPRKDGSPKSPSLSRKPPSHSTKLSLSSESKAAGGPSPKRLKDTLQSQATTRSVEDGQDRFQHSSTEQYPYNELPSREASFSPTWSRENGTSLDPLSYPPMQHQNSSRSKRTSVSSTESLSASNQQHRQKSASDEPWTERSRPMTWTEPLTRQLEDIIHQHFSNHHKINWVKVSALMGSNPVVTKEQCKRRWYLMTQHYNLQSRQHEYPLPSYAMDVDPSETEAPGLDYKRGYTSPRSPNSAHMMEAHPPGPQSPSRLPEHARWTDEELNLLRLGVEKFGRSWGTIQNHYLMDRSTYSISSKWEDLMHSSQSKTQGVPSSTAYPTDNSTTDGEMVDE